METKNADVTKIHLDETTSVSIGVGSIETTGFKRGTSSDESDETDWSDLDEDHMEAMNKDIHNAQVDGMESTLLALVTAGVIDQNDPRLKGVLVDILDALDNHS